MECKGFSPGEVIKKSWALTKEHLGFFIPYILGMVVIWLVEGYLSTKLQIDWQSALAHLFFALINGWLAVGLAKAYLRVAAGEKPSVSDLFGQLKNAFKLIAVAVLYSLLVFVGLLLLIFPGIYWGLKYCYALWVVVDKGAGVKEAFNESAYITEGIKWDLAAMWFLSNIISILGLLALGVGLFVAIPLCGIAYALVYMQFKCESNCRCCSRE